HAEGYHERIDADRSIYPDDHRQRRWNHAHGYRRADRVAERRSHGDQFRWRVFRQRIAVQRAHQLERKQVATYGRHECESSVQRVLDNAGQRTKLFERLYVPIAEPQCRRVYVHDSECGCDRAWIAGRWAGLWEIRYGDGGDREERGGEVRSIQQQRRRDELD